jgi:hypothetical protein
VAARREEVVRGSGLGIGWGLGEKKIASGRINLEQAMVGAN